MKKFGMVVVSIEDSKDFSIYLVEESYESILIGKKNQLNMLWRHKLMLVEDEEELEKGVVDITTTTHRERTSRVWNKNKNNNNTL